MNRATACTLVVLLVPFALDAQVAAGPPEIVRGRVTSDSARAVAGATVIITRGPDRLVQQTTTDSSGRYSLRFDPGTGDYLVYVAAPTYRAARRRVQREGASGSAGRDLVADFVLAREVATLDAIRVQARRPTRASANTSPMTPETGSAERWTDGVSGQLPPTMAGDLDALAGTISGVTITPGGPTILGAGPDANLTTLNGLGTATATVPRAARTQTRVTGATFDPTRGGFSGANIDVRLGPGSRDFQQRSAFVALEPRAWQSNGPAGRGRAARSGGGTVSLGAEGELIRRALTYNVALDVARTEREAQTLFDAEPGILLQSGIAPDSVARIAALSPALGLPHLVRGIAPQLTRVSWLGRFDDTRDSLDTRALTTYLGRVTESGIGASPLSSPLALGRRGGTTLGLQATWRAFTGPGRRILSDSRASVSRVTASGGAVAGLPGAAVTVRSTSGPDAAAPPDVATVSLAGAPFYASRDDRWTWEGANETVWNWRGSRHRFKSLLWGRVDGLAYDLPGDRLGTFGFASIADFAAGRASSFTRTLTQPDRQGSAWNLATAAAHEWIPSRHASVIYGARVEGSGFGGAPAPNAALEEALAVRTGIAPSRWHVSPRLGFSYTYNRDRTNGNGQVFNPLGQFNRGTVGVIRGGIGEFRGLLRPDAVAEARAATGLPGATTTLACTGEAVPAVDWARFGQDPSTVPSACENEGGALAERAPSVVLLEKGYEAPRSWRASLDWTTNIRTWIVRVSTLGSYELAQPGVRDANFTGVPRFTLDAEGNRPIYVSEAAIDARTGAVSAAEARRSADYGRVLVRTSDLRGYGGQLTLGLAPDVVRFRARAQLFASIDYTLQATRREYRGFDGASFGDPREREWAPGAGDARHAVILSGGVTHRRTGTITLFGRLQSGLPFTPIVQGDVNGDGRGGDRAFVPDFRRNGASGLDDALRALRETGSPTAAACLERNAGRAAARNGCRGPWTQTLNMQWVPPIPRRWTGRASARMYFQNVLGGVDQLLHGRDVRGWGTQSAPDPVLLIPRGFDAATRTFRYDVNSRFAETRPTRALVRNPFRVSIDIAVDLSVSYPLQRLRRALEPVRASNGSWQRRSADSIAAFYLRSTSSVHRLLLSNSDSLFLSEEQIRRLQVADSAFEVQVRAIYRPLGEYLATVPEEEPGKAQLDSVAATERRYWRVFWAQVPIAEAIVTPTQRSLIYIFDRMVRTPEHRRDENNRFQFGVPVRLLARTPLPSAPD